MRYPLLLLTLALAAPAPLAAQSFAGPAQVLDGDTLVMSGERVRLHGIDAPEGSQTCQRGGQSWQCGRDAKAMLAEIVAGQTVECLARDRDAYERIVATCRIAARDLAGVMVREGMAIALPQYSTEYVEAEARAKSFGMALWGSVFAKPADYRAANPHLFRGPVLAAAGTGPARTTRFAPAAARPVRAVATAAFRNCAAARAAGAAPLYRGRPGYGAHMDGDGDGVACEPYRAR